LDNKNYAIENYIIKNIRALDNVKIK